MAQTQPPQSIYNLTPEQIQQNIIATKNRLNGVQGQANGMVSEAVNNEINGYGSIIIQLLATLDQQRKTIEAMSKIDKKKALSEKSK